MKKMIAIVMVALMLLSMLSGCTVADNGPGKNKYNLKTVKEGYLTVLTSPDYAPYEFYALDEKGNPTLAGFDMALAQYIADYLELTLEVVPMDFKGIPDELGNGAGDLALAGLSPDPDRLLKMDFSDTYYEGKQAFVTTKANASKFTDLASTNSKDFTIAAQTGTIQMELAAEFSPNADIVSLTKATDIITELLSGQIDGAYVEWDVAASYQKNYPDLQILCEVPYEAEGNVIGVSKGNADLLKYVNEALNKCVSEGTFAKYLEDANNLAAGDNYQGMLDPDGKVPTTNAG
jgi:polar amino acid transport system substrate-binding protein